MISFHHTIVSIKNLEFIFSSASILKLTRNFAELIIGREILSYFSYFQKGMANTAPDDLWVGYSKRTCWKATLRVTVPALKDLNRNNSVSSIKKLRGYSMLVSFMTRVQYDKYSHTPIRSLT